MLLPISLANIFVTGVVYLALDQAGPSVASGLAIAADASQALVAAVVTYYVIAGFIGWFRPTHHHPWIVGSTAKLAARLGGSKPTPMQA